MPCGFFFGKKKKSEKLVDETLPLVHSTTKQAMITGTVVYTLDTHTTLTHSMKGVVICAKAGSRWRLSAQLAQWSQSPFQQVGTEVRMCTIVRRLPLVVLENKRRP